MPMIYYLFLPITAYILWELWVIRQEYNDLYNRVNVNYDWSYDLFQKMDKRIEYLELRQYKQDYPEYMDKESIEGLMAFSKVLDKEADRLNGKKKVSKRKGKVK